MDVNKAKSVLIISRQQADLSLWLAALALGNTLKALDKSYHFFVQPEIISQLPDFFNKDLPLLDLQSGKNLLITLKNLKEKISDLKWKQTGNSLEISLFAGNGSVGNPDISISHLGAPDDLKIFINLNKEEAQKDPIMKDLNLTAGNCIFLNAELPALMIYKFLQDSDLTIDSQDADLLFQSITLATENFTVNRDSKTFSVAAELLKLQNEKKEKKPKQNKNEHSPDKASKKTTPIPAEPINTEKLVEKLKPVEPDVVPADYDPLKPATAVPQPLKLEKEAAPVRPPLNTPLPVAGSH